MNELNKIFAFGEQMVRTMGTMDAPLFVAADVCKALGIQNASDAVADFSEKEKGIAQVYAPGNSDTGGGRGPQDVLVVTEPGLYRLIFRSDKPAAKQFQDWVFQEVLPAIRTSGAYSNCPELWKAFYASRGSKVQLEIYQDIRRQLKSSGADVSGMDVAAQITGSPVLGGLELGHFWNQLLSTLRNGTLKPECVGLKTGAENYFQLVIKPNVLLSVLPKLKPAYASLEKSELRRFLRTEAGWMDGVHRKRIAGTAYLYKWVFNTTPESRPELLEFCRNLWRMKNKEGVQQKEAIGREALLNL